MRPFHEWSLWSTRARVCVTDGRFLDEAVARTRNLLSQVDDAANRFRHDSELSRLHARPGISSSVRLSPMLSGLLRAALKAAEDTGGAVDPTVGRALSERGYDRSFPLLQTAEAATISEPVVPRPLGHSWTSLSLTDDVLVMPTDVLLDLGALAKAVAADQAAALVHQSLGCGVLVCLGGDIATAGRGPIEGWQVRVRDHRADTDSHITLADGWSVATSSTIQRTWRLGDTRQHHIIDPATGRPADSPWRTISVAAPSCAQANTATTATIVKGTHGAEWLNRQGLAARLVGVDGRITLLGGWPAELAPPATDAAA